MKIKNPEKRIKEITKELNEISKNVFSNCVYEVKFYKKKDIKDKDISGIIHTLNGQSCHLERQKRIMQGLKMDKRRLLRELRMLYKKWVS